MKVLTSNLSNRRPRITKLKNTQDAIILYWTFLQRPICATEDFLGYRPKILNIGSEEILKIDREEMYAALRWIKKQKFRERRNQMWDAENGRERSVRVYRSFAEWMWVRRKSSEKMANCDVTLLYRRGDRCSTENWRPISLLSRLYKLLTNIIINKMYSYQTVD